MLGLKAIFVDLMSAPGFDMPIAVLSFCLLLLVAVWRRPLRYGNGLWAGLIMGAAMALLELAYGWSEGYALGWPGMTATASGAITITWAVWPQNGVWKRVAFGTLLYLSPLCLVSLLTIALGLSARVLIWMASGCVLVGICYAVLLTAASLVGARKLLAESDQSIP